ncbi:pyridoxamine 5'-phosphate oxidase family protein [Streptomyces sp. NPDC005538]|uniref:pyridoxamine 5'-phosphate oxidase family protein n=1 Tax=unclassified Streptomyces TaxID=2593676 RepID=UPI0033B040CF
MREPYAMTDSSARADGNPTARTLILTGVGPDGWRFASDAGSVKARDPAQRPFAALPFYWSSLARQIRVRSPVVAAGEEDSAADFLRPSRSHWPGSTTNHPCDTRDVGLPSGGAPGARHGDPAQTVRHRRARPHAALDRAGFAIS